MTDYKRSGPGRPPIAPGHLTDVVNIRLPDYIHDSACKIAVHEGISVGAVIRRALVLYYSCNSLTVNSVTENPRKF